MTHNLYRTIRWGLVIASVLVLAAGCKEAGPPAPDDPAAFNFIYLDWPRVEAADHYDVKHQRRQDKCWWGPEPDRVFTTNLIIRVDPHDEVRWAWRTCNYVRRAAEERSCTEWSEWKYIEPQVDRSLPPVDACGT